jgi:hypothetical protein
VWSTRNFFGLRCDLSDLPTVRPAKVPLEMRPAGAGFEGFLQEQEQVEGFDLGQVLMRERWRTGDVRELFVATADGAPAYCQWLVRPADLAALDVHEPGAHPSLPAHEVLLEGAYTFVAFRRMGAMADGMAQLLRVARDEGYTSALTYVEDANIASLRGCEAVGFRLDHVRVSAWRLGRFSGTQRPPGDGDRAAWGAAVARK